MAETSEEERPLRFIDETVVRMAELMTPELENFSGKVHGGSILAILDKVAYVCACRYSGTYCVTVSVDQVEFKEPVHVGELLHFTGRVVHVGRSSMEIEILVEAQHLYDGSLRHTNTCYFTMVAVRDGKTITVPRLAARTDEDGRRYDRAVLRREIRELYRQRRSEQGLEQED